ncbi:MAG: flavodoxin family protein [Candidatus Bathyarchaeia archaeon]
MKVLIVYDTVSPSRVTEQVARAIGEVLRQEGLEVDSFYVGDADKTVMKDYDCLLAGAPTMAFRTAPGIMQFLDNLQASEVSGKLAAAFDTQLKSFLSGSAVKGIEGKLKGLGLKLASAPLVAYVQGSGSQNMWRLRDGELEKVKNWAQDLAKGLKK